jgi:5-methylcytosine-specific restriction enzyme B
MLDEKVAQELSNSYKKLREAGELRSREQLDGYYRLFRERFGPDHLANLDGRELLYTMHALSSSHRNSLVYWLEFKNDEEFPTPIFGSIAGGSSLKYGIYQRKEDGVWMTGHPHKQVELSEEEAIAVARRHRNQLLRGAELLQQLSANARDGDYLRLQSQMDADLPDLSNTAWAHKYFHLLFPERLDDFHVAEYQRFHLIKVLQPPPEGSGRYVSAGRFVAIARELDMPMNHLTTLLNRRNGRPYRYWRVLVQYADIDEFKEIWEPMRQGGFIALGWGLLGDLSEIGHDQTGKTRVRELMQTYYGKGNRGWGQEIFNFVTGIQEGDIVLAFEKSTVLGIGRITGSYQYDTSLAQAPHRRAVEWLNTNEWTWSSEEAKGRAVKQLYHSENLIEVERRLLNAPTPPTIIRPMPRQIQLVGIPGRVQTILERKKQVILYGPPGTGKTYWAKLAAQDLAAYRCFGRPFADLGEAERGRIWEGDGTAGALVRMCSFHPAYGYEDFLEGYRPETVEQQLVFERRDGIFKQLCDDARQHSELNYYLIVDEINRGDIPRIFGELLTVLEKDKRGQNILLPLSKQKFSVPDNVYVLGTMNTADRSIALLDTALRRRFGFVELMPDSTFLKGAVVEGTIPLGGWLDNLNERILEHVGRDARNLQIGHAYLIDNGRPVTDFGHFTRILQEDIVPLLEEYCYEDYSALSRILGDGLVDEQKQRIRQELFQPERHDELLTALLKLSPELIATADVVESQPVEEEVSEDEDGEE